MKTRVLFNLTQIRPSASGGIAAYAKNLIEELATRTSIDLHIAETFFNHKNFANLNKNPATKHLLTNPNAYDSDLIKLTRDLCPEYVIHPVAGSSIEKVGNEKYLVCIADLQHKTYPKFFSTDELWARDAAFSYAAKHAHRIFTLSAHAKSEICHHFDLSDKQVIVVSPALDGGFSQNEGKNEIDFLAKEYGLTSPYIYYPANFWPHKNHETLLQSLPEILKAWPTVKLALSGGQSEKRADLIDLARELEISHRVINFGYLPENHARALISYADVIVFPSLFEGFGIPILEALSCNRVICCSDTTSIPEVAGAAAYYFSPYHAHSIAEAVIQAREQGPTREMLSAQRAQLDKFNYKKSVDSLLSAIEPQAQRKKTQPKRKTKQKVSVITPSYNQAEFIEKTIKSVLTQDYDNIEYIVKDGGSTDRTLTVLNKYKEQLRFTSERDAGQTSAINAGILESKGDFICYLNSDDILLPGAISAMVDFLESNPDVDVVYGRADYIDRTGGKLGQYETFSWNKKRFETQCFICQPASMWRKSTHEIYGMFDESLNYAMDYEFWMRIVAQGGKIAFCEGKLANSRLYEETKTLSARGHIFKEISIISRKHFGSTNLYWTYHHSRYLTTKYFPMISFIPPQLRERATHLLAIAVTAARRLPTVVSYCYVRYMDSNWKNGKILFARLMTRLRPQNTKLNRKVKIEGFSSDGWASNDLRVSFEKTTVISSVILCGKSPNPQHLQLTVDGKEHDFETAAGEFLLEIQPAQNQIKDIKLTASNSIMNSNDGTRSFQLTYTNLFDDLDLC